LKSLPTDRIFLETDGAEADIKNIYEKVSSDLDVTIDTLKAIVLNNFYSFFNSK